MVESRISGSTYYQLYINLIENADFLDWELSLRLF